MMKSVNDMGHYVSAVAGSVMHTRSKNVVRFRALAVGAVFAGIFLVSTSEVALAATKTLKEYGTEVSAKTNVITDIVSYICYIGGAILSALGVVDLKKHVENPSQTPMKNGLAKLGFGGVMLALPFVSGVMQKTMESGGSNASFKKFGTIGTI